MYKPEKCINEDSDPTRSKLEFKFRKEHYGLVSNAP